MKVADISIGKNLVRETARPAALLLLLLFFLALNLPHAQAQKFTLKRLSPPGSNYSFAFGLNNNGKVVGSFRNSKNVFEGFIYDGSTYKKILQSASLTEANGVNDDNIVVGDYIGKDQLSHGFFLRDGRFIPFDASGNNVSTYIMRSTTRATSLDIHRSRESELTLMSILGVR